MKYLNETPKNINDLLKMANDRTNWKHRLEAVHKMKRYDCDLVREKLANLALHDRVFIVKKEAYKVAHELDISVNGKPVFLGKKDIGYKLGDFKSLFSTIKKRVHMEKLDVEKVKKEMKILNPEMYDVMIYEKGKKINNWIKDVYGSLHNEKLKMAADDK